MERRDLEIFLTLAEELHFSRTAERLHVSQARVSQSVKQLERRVGAPLFDRTSRRVALTPIGARLHADLAPAYRRIVDALRRATEEARGTNRLRVGFEAPALADLIPHLPAFRDAYPTAEIVIREADFRRPLDLLRADEVDVLVTALRSTPPDLAVGPTVLSEPVVLATAAAHPFARRPSVVLADLARDTVFTAAYPTPGVTSDREFATFQELLTAVARREGVCPLGAHAQTYFTRPGIAFTPISDAPPLDWVMVWRKGGETATVREFASLAR
jgi:DNA-binding transcriptional LysR family regulator